MRQKHKKRALETADKAEIGGRAKRDVSVADESGTARVTVWEGHTDVMKKDQSYCLKNFMVREYQSTKYLTMAKEASEIVPIEDIGPVAEQEHKDDQWCVIKDVTVAGVPLIHTNHACSARLELSHIQKILANGQRWTA